MNIANENRKGYKNTKLGWIPEDWVLLRVDEVFDFLPTNSFPRSQLNYDIKNDSIYNIHYGDIHSTFKNSILDFEIEKNIPVINNEIAVSSNLSFLKNGDIIIADASEDYEGVGKAIEIFNLMNKKVVAGLHTFALRDNNSLLAIGFRAYIFKNDNVAKALKIIATGSKVYGISKANIRKFLIPLPPLPEQKKIAEILSTWDDAILNTEQLIEKLKLRKKGLMQELLTGKTRLKGFTGKWKVVKLLNICEFYSGGTPETSNRSFYVGTIPFIRSGEINSLKTILCISEEGLKNSSAKMVNKGDLLYALYGATSGEVGISKISGAINQAVLCIRSQENITFLYYVLLNLKKSIISTYLQGGQGNLSANIIKNIQIKIPELIEQNAIAEILTTVDEEIKVNEKYLLQLQSQKKGLMQKLLTGEVRVNVDEEVV